MSTTRTKTTPCYHCAEEGYLCLTKTQREISGDPDWVTITYAFTATCPRCNKTTDWNSCDEDHDASVLISVDKDADPNTNEGMAVRAREYRKPNCMWPNDTGCEGPSTFTQSNIGHWYTCDGTCNYELAEHDHANSQGIQWNE